MVNREFFGEIKTAIVLVGGFGTRLRPLTLETPKQMLPIAHRPMIELVLERLAEAGISDAVLALGYKPDAFIHAYPDGKCAGVNLHYVVEPEPLDTAGAIKFAYLKAGLEDKTILAINGDVICEADLGELAMLHFQKADIAQKAKKKTNQSSDGTSTVETELATLLATSVEDPTQFGVMVIGEESKVLEFYEKPDSIEAYGNKINAGIYILDSAVLNRIESNVPVSIEKEIFPKLVEEGKLFAYISDKYWIDAGTPETYLQAQLDVAQRNGVDLVTMDTSVADSAEVQNSSIGRDVVIMDGAKIFDSAILDGVRVEANAIVENSILGREAHIGEGAKLTNLCVIGNKEKIPPFAELNNFRNGVSSASNQPT